jgi:perosamine synthetase
MNNQYIPLDAPSLIGNERKYLNQCIDTNWISWQGEFVGTLESEMAKYCNTSHGLTIVNGTYALVLALQALKIGPGDEVILPTFTMSATAFAVSSVGARVVWVDNAKGSLTLNPLEVAKKIGPNTKAVIAVHLYGRAVDMDSLLEITNPLQIPVIEDVAEGFGAKTSGKIVGGLGLIGCHSFHNKILASGEGGAVTLNDSNLAKIINDLRTPPPDNAGGKVVALNNRMSNLASAVALAQLERADELIAKRRAVAQIYDQFFTNIPGVITYPERSDEFCVYWRYQIGLDKNHKMSNIELVKQLKTINIEARPVFTPMHLHPKYENDAPGDFPNAVEISSQAIDLPSSPNLTKNQVEIVANAVLKAVV